MDDCRMIVEWLTDDRRSAIIAWPNGSKYMGEVTKEGEREGLGTQTWRDGRIYSGDFKKDQRDG